MRHLIVLLLCCTAHSLLAQKTTPSKPAAAKTARPTNEKTKAVKDSVPLSENLVLSKLGKTKVTAHFLKTYPSPGLERNEEVLYFLYEHFYEHQVQRIIALADRPTMATSAGYDSVKKKGDRFTAYLLKPYRYISPYDSTYTMEMALLYIPYSERENFNDLYTIQPQTPEGAFVSADYTVLESENMARLPPIPKWEKKSLFTLPNYRATHKEEPQPAVAKTTTAGTAEKPTPKQLAKSTLEDILAVFKKLSAAADNMNLMTDNINAAMEHRFKGPGNTVSEEGIKAAKDIKTSFYRCLTQYEEAKKALEYVKEDRLSGTICDNSYYIYKAKENMHHNLVDIVFEKDFLKTYINIAQPNDNTSYSLWFDNMKSLKKRYEERMLTYAKELYTNTNDMKAKCQACLEQVSK